MNINDIFHIVSGTIFGTEAAKISANNSVFGKLSSTLIGTGTALLPLKYIKK